jgi:hypothetical protein
LKPKKDSTQQRRTAGRMVTLGKTRVPAVIAALFERFAMQAAAAGHKRYSARGVAERIRWRTMVENIGDYKVNNNWAAPLARCFLSRHPELPGFFELRERRQRDGKTGSTKPSRS